MKSLLLLVIVGVTLTGIQGQQNARGTRRMVGQMVADREVEVNEDGEVEVKIGNKKIRWGFEGMAQYNSSGDEIFRIPLQNRGRPWISGLTNSAVSTGPIPGSEVDGDPTTEIDSFILSTERMLRNDMTFTQTCYVARDNGTLTLDESGAEPEVIELYAGFLKCNIDITNVQLCGQAGTSFPACESEVTDRLCVRTRILTPGSPSKQNRMPNEGGKRRPLRYYFSNAQLVLATKYAHKAAGADLSTATWVDMEDDDIEVRTMGANTRVTFCFDAIDAGREYFYDPSLNAGDPVDPVDPDSSDSVECIPDPNDPDSCGTAQLVAMPLLLSIMTLIIRALRY